MRSSVFGWLTHRFSLILLQFVDTVLSICKRLNWWALVSSYCPSPEEKLYYFIVPAVWLIGCRWSWSTVVLNRKKKKKLSSFPGKLFGLEEEKKNQCPPSGPHLFKGYWVNYNRLWWQMIFMFSLIRLRGSSSQRPGCIVSLCGCSRAGLVSHR